MADLSSVETLRAAAAKLRTLRSAATNGPWEAHEDGLVWADRVGDPVSGSVEPEDAKWIALVHPGIAEPLAYWLDGAALAAEEIGPDHRAVEFARVLLGVPDGE